MGEIREAVLLLGTEQVSNASLTRWKTWNTAPGDGRYFTEVSSSELQDGRVVKAGAGKPRIYCDAQPC